MKNLVENFNLGKFFFLIFSLSLLVGFYFNEDVSGGSTVDFYRTWDYVLALKENYFIGWVEDAHWSLHFPLHYIILSKLNFIITDRYLLRLFFCFVSIFLPIFHDLLPSSYQLIQTETTTKTDPFHYLSILSVGLTTLR